MNKPLKVVHPLFKKTDQRSLYEFSLQNYIDNGWRVEHTEDYQTHVEFDAMTEYERNFRSLGHHIYRIIATKEQ